MVDAIKVENLTKQFDGFTAVNEISFAVRQGELFGLLGPNGAGKSPLRGIPSGTVSVSSSRSPPSTTGLRGRKTWNSMP
jgi:ABC-2 type transport system ATP-binding protein